MSAPAWVDEPTDRPSPSALAEAARRLADEVLFPAAVEVQARGVVPVEHLDLLAAAGLYGLFAPPEGDVAAAHLVVEALAGGDLATALVWLQHHGALRAVAASDRPGVRETWLRPLMTGGSRAGVAVGGLRPGPPLLRARTVAGGYLLDGAAPWVTGWGLVDLLHVAARDADDIAIWMLLDAHPARSITVSWPSLLAVMASRTAHLSFESHFVPADRVTGTLPFGQWPARDAQGLRTNGSLALGLANRCCRMLGELGGRLAEEVDHCRSVLDAATPATMPAARAAASELANRCAASLIVATGARSMVVGGPEEKLFREAAFLLVFGARPTIRAALLEHLSPVD